MGNRKALDFIGSETHPSTCDIIFLEYNLRVISIKVHGPAREHNVNIAYRIRHL